MPLVIANPLLAVRITVPHVFSVGEVTEGTMSKILYGEVLGPEIALDGDTRRSEQVRRKFWTTLKKAVRYIPFSDDLVAAYFCALDPTTPP